MVSRSHRANAMARQSQYSDCRIGVASSCGDAGYRALRARHVARRVARLAADVALTPVGSHRLNLELDHGSPSTSHSQRAKLRVRRRRRAVGRQQPARRQAPRRRCRCGQACAVARLQQRPTLSPVGSGHRAVPAAVARPVPRGPLRPMSGAMLARSLQASISGVPDRRCCGRWRFRIGKLEPSSGRPPRS